jgi:hypothetical protein
MLRLGVLLAPHRQGHLLPSSRLMGHPDVGYNYMAKQPIAIVGLTPARYTALWAANKDSVG